MFKLVEDALAVEDSKTLGERLYQVRAQCRRELGLAHYLIVKWALRNGHVESAVVDAFYAADADAARARRTEDIKRGEFLYVQVRGSM